MLLRSKNILAARFAGELSPGFGSLVVFRSLSILLHWIRGCYMDDFLNIYNINTEDINHPSIHPSIFMSIFNTDENKLLTLLMM